MAGKILRFDEVRGYGFIVPDVGDEDVFMHANDLLEEKYLYQAGRHVEYFLEDGEKGPKASQVRLISQPGSPSAAPPVPVMTAAPTYRSAETGVQDDDMSCDVLNTADFSAELTEALIAADDTLTTAQVKHVRQRLIRLAVSHGWVDSAES